MLIFRISAIGTAHHVCDRREDQHFGLALAAQGSLVCPISSVSYFD